MTAKIKSHRKRSSTSHKHKPRGISDKKFASVYWPYIPIVILASLLLAFSSGGGVLATMIKHPTGKVLGYATNLSGGDLLNQTNIAREENYVKPLQLNDLLARAAQAKANDMAAHNYWSHQTPSGNPPWIFAEAQGYNYQKLGENLATGFPNSQAVIKGWLTSTEHRHNMLDSAYTQVGFGYANIDNYTAAGGGPMTIVVAFYGQPIGVSDASNNKLVGATSPNSSSNSPLGFAERPLATSRAQLAFAKTPFSPYATYLTVSAMMMVIGIWIGRHLISVRRTLVHGEAFIFSHPMLDLSLILLGFFLFTLSKTAGLID